MIITFTQFRMLCHSLRTQCMYYHIDRGLKLDSDFLKQMEMIHLNKISSAEVSATNVYSDQ